MKPIKRLEYLGLRKENDSAFLQRFEQSIKNMISRLAEVTSRVHGARTQKLGEQRGQSVSQSLRLDAEEGGNGAGASGFMAGDRDRMEQRFQDVTVPVTRIKGQPSNGGDKMTQIMNWVGSMCKQVLSVGFLLLKNGELQVNKVKAYCSENILRNLLHFAQQNSLQKPEIQAINECLRDQIFPYFCLKYPQSQESEVNLALAGQLLQSDNIDQNANDLVFRSGVRFSLEQSGNYNSQIMQFVNYIVRLPNLTNSFQSDQDQKIMALADKFNRDMEHIFRKVQTQKNIPEMKRFNPKKQQFLPELVPQREQSQKQKQSYLQKVRSYTSYQIGQKLSKNFKEFSESQIQSGDLRLESSAIMRVMTKWCEELWACFDENQIVNRENPFRMKDGSEGFIKKFHVTVLSSLLQRQKDIILTKLKEIQQNNYHQQCLFSHKPPSEKLQKFTPEQALIGQFTTVIYRNNENYLINYLNMLIHGIMRAMEDFEKFAKIELERSWVLEDIRKGFEEWRIRPDFLAIVMDKVYQQKERKEDVRDKVPQLISFRIGDLLRCKCSSRETQITALYKEFERISYTNPSLLKIVRVKNRLDRGNRDILMNLMYKETLLVEVQLAIKAEKSKFITCSNQFNHFIYELRRAQFGPITQMCSIWVNQDPRSAHYLKYLSNSNSRNLKLVEEKRKQARSQCCSSLNNIDIVRLPFTCTNCESFYYHCSFTEKHSTCRKCGNYTCFLCQLGTDLGKDTQNLLPELSIDPGIPLKQVVLLAELPDSGAILNLKSKIRKPKIFVTIQNNGEYLLFQNINQGDPQKQIKIRLLHTFKSSRIPQSFLKENIVYSCADIKTLTPKITYEIARQHYFIPKYFKQAQKASKISVSQIRNNLDQKFFINNPDIVWPAAKKINFSENKFFKIDQLHKKFPSIVLAILSDNEIKQIPQECSNWKNLRHLYIARNPITQIHPNIKFCKELAEIQLQRCRLERLPEEFGELEKLVSLNLDSNPLLALPDTFEELKSLQYLNVGGSHLVSLPESFGNLKSLKKLDIFWATFCQKLPQSFGNLSSLQYMNAMRCSIKKLPQSFGKLKKLKDLNLNGNHIQELCQSFGQLESLKKLDAEQNEIKKLPNNFSLLRSLQDCSFYYNKIQELPQNIGLMTSLKKLNLGTNNITRIPDSIGQLPKLQYLKLSYNKLTEINRNIFKITTLKFLYVDGNQISQIPQQISKLTNLATLGLNRNKLTDGSFPLSLKTLRSLTDLSLSSNPLTQLPSLIVQMPWLQILGLQALPLTQLPQQMRKLTKLALLYIDEKGLTEQSKEILKELRSRQKENMRVRQEELKRMEKQESLRQY